MMLPTFPLPVPEEWLGAVREGGRGRRREKGGGEGRGGEGKACWRKSSALLTVGVSSSASASGPRVSILDSRSQRASRGGQVK